MQKFKKYCILICFFITISTNIPSSHKPSRHKKKPGTIILLNGTSSAGKSTLIKALHELYPDFQVASIDEYTKTHQFNGFANLRYNSFYTMIYNQATAGKNILVDTVLYHTRYKKYDAMLQSPRVQLIKILVYCPVDCLIAHVQQRNKSGNSMEHRTINQAFRAFLGLYTMQTKQHNLVIDTIHSDKMKAALQKSLNVIANWSDKNKKRQRATNKKMVHQFNLDTPHQIFITPSHHWDLIVNTSLNSPEEIAHKISEFIEKRSHHFNRD
jgi:predicted AAA+ superfamily ATPase